MQDLASTVLPLIAIALVFWLLIIRPQSRRQRELRDMQASLTVGDEVVLTSGIHGVVRGVDDAVAQVEVATGVTIRVARAAIGIVIPTDNDDVPGTGEQENQ
ncbi:preprotein translocase subunit YajC [Nocardioides sp.]|uniref:preprotein translocase subunit YajC n=1 Tax=Nocardioides sp. TaxID=35761 RepID=UPI001A2B633C|nr:preprotein translocase subunit YajC [Nocardioides sp.]MBJ7359429.1 preprotein translocase subunit YajC [Nocardioides sp.]